MELDRWEELVGLYHIKENIEIFDLSQEDVQIRKKWRMTLKGANADFLKNGH